MGVYAALGVASGLFAFALSLNIRQVDLNSLSVTDTQYLH